jgi:phosphoribosylformylglycinamidine (FGAM) synthase-like amidotransferase family enzyme
MEADRLKATWMSKIRRMDTVMKGIQAIKMVNWKSVHGIEINGRQLLSRPKLIYIELKPLVRKNV